ncbi:MAG: MmcQ/YjbR family DNA-binding protein [Bacteroidetes bacterium]|nr:MmcQ/YjbR family DNA-binding protein [Bacteroidota bacterium]
MTIESLRAYCMAKTGTTERTPFGEGVLVFDVAGKIFALTSLEDIPARVNLKCDPERAVELRDRYEGVTPGYHMNKKHWNTVLLDGGVPQREVLALIDHSYNLIVASLPKKKREELEELRR